MGFFFLVGYGSSKRMWLNKTNRVGLWVIKEGGWVMVFTTNKRLGLRVTSLGEVAACEAEG